MALELEIHTDRRVADLLPKLMKSRYCKDVTVVDSVNYGEGFDFLMMGVECRLYDDIRSDMTRQNQSFVNGDITWDEAFKVTLSSTKGQGCLTIEIDRHDKYPLDKQQRVRDELRILTN